MFLICLQPKRDDLALSAEKDHTVQCTCFTVNKYYAISAYLSLLHTLPEASLCKRVLTYGEYSCYTSTKAEQVLNGNMKQKAPKTYNGIIQKGRIMLQRHDVPGQCSQEQAGFSSWPFGFPTLIKLSTFVPHTPEHSFQRDPIFNFTTYGKNPNNRILKEMAVPVQ